VGNHVQIDQNTAIGHDCVLGDFSRMNPQACVSGAANIGRRAMIGANAIVLQGLTVCDDARVGAGAVVTHSVDPATTVMGVPARRGLLSSHSGSLPNQVYCQPQLLMDWPSVDTKFTS
jgi:acetyltransferase-like isoleucine patch superfamily enzyme